jgi:signal peptidase
MTHMAFLPRLIRWIGNWILILLLLLLVLIHLAPRYWGIELLTVASGSMAPYMPMGSIAAVREVDPTHVLPGDIITFASPEDPLQLVTHRVQEVTVLGRDRAFRTKGDANDEADLFLVPPSMMRGRVLAAIPLLGYLAQFSRTRMGWLLMAAAPTAIIVGSELINILRAIWTQPVESRKQKPSAKEDAASRFRRLTDPHWPAS